MKEEAKKIKNGIKLWLLRRNPNILFKPSASAKYKEKSENDRERSYDFIGNYFVI